MSAKVNNTAVSEGFFEHNLNLLAGIIIAATAVFGLLLFNLRIDEGGDDSTYICRAIDLLREGRYPNYQGPLYPMFLAVVIAIFGQSLVALKLSSLVLIVAGQALFFFTLRRRINAKLLLATLALLSINSYYLYFGSQTFSEAFFILIEYVFFALVMRYDSAENESIGKEIRSALLVALAIVAAFLVRTVGIGFAIVAIVYLLSRKRFRKTLILVASVAVLTLAWYGLRTAIWGASAEGGSVQMASLMQKHPYNPEEGQETIGGYVARFAENSNLYLSKHTMRIAGFKSEEDRETSLLTTLIFYICFGYGAYKAFRRNRFVFFMAVNVAVMLGITFVILQTLWDQTRLIIPYLSMAYVVVLYGIYHLATLVTKQHATKIALAVVVISGGLSFSQTTKKIDMQTLRKNLAGDPLYGYTPDWHNYLYMCMYADRTLPDSAYVACRKPNMARIHCRGRKFYGVYNFDTEDADELVEQFRSRGVTHVILASLRRDPQNPGYGIINTLHRYLNFICMKYPAAFNIVHAVGEAPNQRAAQAAVYEPAYLLEVNYDYIDKMRSNQSVENE